MLQSYGFDGLLFGSFVGDDEMLVLVMAFVALPCLRGAKSEWFFVLDSSSSSVYI